MAASRRNRVLPDRRAAGRFGIGSTALIAVGNVAHWLAVFGEGAFEPTARRVACVGGADVLKLANC